MNEQEQSIAIAEACGWVHIVNNTPYKWRTSSGNPTTQKPPDYLNDLNAMHAALKSQTQAFRAEFDRLLHALAEEKHLLVTELEAKDWAGCFISCLQSQRDSGK